jgi:transposase-like protein
MIKVRISQEDIVEALRSTGGAIAAAAQRLGISPRTLRRRLDTMGQVLLGPQMCDDELMRQQIEHIILQKALEGDVKCAIFYLKRIGWGREIVQPVLWNGYPQI